MSRIISLFLLIVTIIFCAEASSVSIFGPKRYDRTTGKPNTCQDNFVLKQGATAPFTLTVTNGAPNGSNRVSSGTVTINGVVIIKQSDLNQQVGSLQRVISLNANNTIEVDLSSTPGSYLTIEITGQAGTTIPILSITQPTDGFITKTSPVSVVGTVSGTTPLIVKANDFLMTVNTNGVVSGQVALVEGSNNISFIATDATGGTATVVRKVILDSRPPTLIVSTPVDNFTTNQTSVSVSGTVKDSTSVTVKVNGTSVTASNSSFSSTLALVEGINTITIVATDATGNQTTVARTVRRDSQPPVLAITQPIDRLITNQLTVPVTGTVTDLPTNSQAGASQVQVTVDGKQVSVDHHNAFYALITLAEGQNTITVVATDAAGNSTKLTRMVTRDDVSPTLTVSEPADGLVTKSNSISVKGTVHDQTTVTVQVNGVVFPVDQTGAFSGTLSLKEGKNILQIVATDAAKNSTTIIRTIIRDTTPPDIDVYTPWNNITTGDSVVIVSGKVTDCTATVVNISINGGKSNPVPLLCFGFFIQKVSLSGGTNVITITATDAAGNSSIVTRTINRKGTTLKLVVSEPVDETITRAGSILVKGTATGTGAITLKVNGGVISVSSDGSFSTSVNLAEGTNLITTTATDASNTTLTVTRLVIKDTTPPVLIVDKPVDGFLTKDAAVAVSGTVSDSTSVNVLVNGHAVSVGIDGSFNYSLSTVEGTNVITIVATDTLGNATTITRWIRKDTTPPTLTITTPNNDAITSVDSIFVAGSVKDSSAVTLKINEVSINVNADGTFSGYAPLSSEGANELYVIAIDALGNVTASSRLVIMDTQPPIVNLTSPIDSLITNLQSITVSGTVTDSTTVTLTINGNSPQGINVPLGVGGVFSYQLPVAEGWNTIIIVATDAAGNKTTITRTVNKDTQPPVVNLTSPIDSLITNIQSITVNGTVTDLTTISLTVNGNPVTTGNSGTFSAQISLNEGSNTFTIIATDAAGNSTTISRGAVLDSQAPTVNLLLPVDSTITNLSSITVSGKITDASFSSLTIAGNVVTVSTDGYFSTTVSLNEGLNSVVLTAIDKAGNTTTISRSIIRDSQAPVVNIQSPIDSLITKLQSITVSGTVSDSTEVQLTVKVGSGTPSQLEVGSDGTFSTVINLVEGKNIITIGASDAAGNKTTVSRLVIRDTQAPIVNLTSPIDSLITNLQLVTVSGTVLDSTSATLKINGNNVPVGVSGVFSYQSSIIEGKDTITVVATDAAGNTTTISRLVIRDSQSPIINLTSPIDNLITNLPSVTFSGTVKDSSAVMLTVTVGSGTPSQLKLGSDGTFSTQVSLVEGTNTILITATDTAGNSTTIIRNVRLDSTPPKMVLTSPIDSSVTNKTKIVISGSVVDSSSVTFTVNGIAFPISTNGLFSDTLSINEGKNYFSIVATDKVGNQTTIKRTVIRDTQAPTILIASPTANATTTDSLISVIGSIIDSTQISITVNGAIQTTGLNGGFTLPLFLSNGNNTVSVVATDQAGNTSTLIRTITKVSMPPDPITVAPKIDATIATNICDATEFLYTGSNTIQKGMTPGSISKAQVSVIRGKVLDGNKQALKGVNITVLNHPEYGSTISRDDGMYDLAVNGGSYITINYDHVGYLSAQRQVDARLQLYRQADDVILLRMDTVVQHVDLTTPQIVQGRPVSDSLGTRRPALFIRPGTSANLVFNKYTYRVLNACSIPANRWCSNTIIQPSVTIPTLVDSLVPTKSISVRMMEYTANANGEIAIPGVLPASVAYTFAFELSADEMLSAGARDIRFNQPAVFYLENVLGFPVGLTVPFGWYDRQNGYWNTSPNGKVIKIIDTVGGIASIDYNGDGIAELSDTLLVKGISLLEQQYLALNYKKGQSLWRCEITHLGTFAAGFTMVGPSNAQEPQNPLPDRYAKVDRDNIVAGSVIGVQNQTLSESTPIVNTPITMNYKSDRVFGRREAYCLDIPLTGTTIPQGMSKVTLEIEIVGRKYDSTFTPQPNLTYHFEWDGKDAYGRRVQGQQNILTIITYSYPSQFALPPDYNNCFATPSGQIITQYVPGCKMISKTQIWEGKIGAFDFLSLGIGGWSLSLHHGYDCLGRILYKGDGTVSSANVMDNVINTVMGNKGDINNWCADYGLDGTLATQTMDWNVLSLAFGKNDELYYNVANNYIRKIDTAGIINTIGGLIGNGTISYDTSTGKLANCCAFNYNAANAAINVGPDGCVYFVDYLLDVIWKITQYGERIRYAGVIGANSSSGDGGTATQASFNSPSSIAFGKDGCCYIFEGNNSRIRKISPDGIVTTVAGTGVSGYSGDGGPATNAKIQGGMVYSNPSYINGNGTTDMVVGDDGSIYFAEGAGCHIRKITPDGIIHTIAGTGDQYNTGDGGPAVNARVWYPMSLSLGKDRTLFLSTRNSIRAIATDGYIKTIVGGGNNIWLDNCPATAYQLTSQPAIAMGQDNNLYAAEAWTSPKAYSLSHIFKVTPPLPGITLSEILVASEDGSEQYVFTYSGRHLCTLDALTGVVKYSFGYDSTYKLITITDVDSLVTHIERDSNDNATAIISPYGVRTELNLDSLGYLLHAVNPASESNQFTYTSGGLMTSKTDARGNTYNYSYDSLGYLTMDLDPVGGYTTLSRVYDSTGYTITSLTAMGKKTTYRVDHLRDGSRVLTNTDANGLKTITTIGTDGSSTTTTPDGMSTPDQQKPDPRYGMQSPLQNVTVNTPGGLQSNVNQYRTITQMTGNAVTGLQDSIMVNGKPFKTRWDGNQRMLTKISAEGRQTFSFYDVKGRVIKDSIPGLLATTHKYDSKGRKIEDNQGGRKTTYAYDSLGRQAKVTDPYGRITQFFYDLSDRLVRTVLPDSSEVSFTYDKNGNMLSLTPPSKPEHTFDYSKVDLETLYTPPFAGDSARATAKIYNFDREITCIARPDSLNMNFFYGGKGSLAGQPKKISYDRGTMTFLYDTIKALVTGVISPNGDSLLYQYDGQLPKYVRWTGSVNGNIKVRYNNDMKVLAETINNKDSINFVYDKDGLLTNAGALKLKSSTANNLLLSDTLGNVVTNYIYNSLGEIASQQSLFGSAVLYQVNYTRDSLGRVSEKAETIQGIATKYDYVYDVKGQLLQVSKNDTIVSTYTYDPNGNRIAHMTPISADSGTYDVQDRLLTYSSTQYLYSQNGDLRQKIVGTRQTDGGQADTTHYDYDAMGNLLSVVLPTGTRIDYITDGAGRRIIRKTNGQITNRWLYSDELRISGEVDSVGNVVSHFVYATKQNVPEYVLKGSIAYRVVTDQLGSVRQVINSATGQVVQQMDYDEFGNVTNSSGQQIVPMGFAGGIYDAQTGLTRFGARDYEASVGRWMVKDPILFKAEESDLYVYCSNNPINITDPTGKVNMAMVKAISYGVLGAMTNAFSSWHRGDDNVGTSAAIGFIFGFLGGSIDRSPTTNVALATGLSILGNVVAQQFGNNSDKEINKVDIIFNAIGSFSVAAYTECFSGDFAGAAMAATVFCGIQQMLIGEMIYNLYKR